MGVRKRKGGLNVIYYRIEPEVAGGFGERTELDAASHPPRVTRLHYQFDGWLGDDIVTNFPCYLVTDRVREAFSGLGVTGCRFADVEVTTSEQFRQLFPDTILPRFSWLLVDGVAGVDDIGMSGPPHHQAVVSQRVLACLRSFTLNQCDVWEYEGVADATRSHPLFAPAPLLDDERPDLYGHFIGSWDVEVIDHLEGGETRHRQGEWHFAWVLEGRAIQDVFIVPARAERPAPATQVLPGDRYGATIRFFDAARKQWRIVWVNAVTGTLNTFHSRRAGQTIVQDGVDESGAALRWSFLDVEQDRFRWLGQRSVDGGQTWHTVAEFLARRREESQLP